MKNLWNKRIERKFFKEARKFVALEQLFYITDNEEYVAYWPKKYKGKKYTLQSRNSLIGKFTEKWSRDLINKIASKINCYAIQGAICHEIGLPKNSSADVAICKNKNIVQKPEDIVAIFEIKMSLVWNWKYEIKNDKNKRLICIGDFTSHQGNPGLLRSDSMLKAIGKSINIRVGSYKSSHIPIIILTNTPITKTYYKKVDHLKQSGIIQNFLSVNPYPTNKEELNIKYTNKKGFIRIDSYCELENSLLNLLKQEKIFFSSMKKKSDLGRIIKIANKQKKYENKAEKFLELIKGK